MAGQIELRYKLADRSKRALVSRIAVSSVLDAMTLEETAGMIDFRCNVAQVANRFEEKAVEAVYNLSKGIPREVIKLCAMSVQYALLNDMDTIPREIVELACQDIVHPGELKEDNSRKNISNVTMRKTRKLKAV